MEQIDGVAQIGEGQEGLEREKRVDGTADACNGRFMPISAIAKTEDQ